MKANPIYYTLAGITITWIVYTLISVACFSCFNMKYYLIPHLVLLILFIAFLCLYHKTVKLANEIEQKSKDEDLGRKIRWEKEQFDVYKLRKQFDIDINKEQLDFEKLIEANKLSFDQLLTFMKEFKGKEESTIKDEIEKLQKDIEILKSKKDIFIDIAHKTLQNNKTSNNRADGNTENKA